jgi:type IV pilus assembly protein PilC
MAQFAYSIRDGRGHVSSGSLTAESRIDALNTLRNQGMFVLELVEQDIDTPIHGAGFGGGFFQRVKLEELSVFTRQLAAMVGAGIAITRCLDTLARQQRNTHFARLLTNIKTDVSTGMPLSAAMAKYPRVFNAMMISLILSAEETGTLDTTLEQLAESFEAEVNLRHQISAGTRYPLIVSVAALLVVTFVMIFVIPQFKTIFDSLGADLPLMTAIVMAVALFMKRFWFVILGLYLGLPWLMGLLNTLPGGRKALDALKLKLPVFGDLNRKIILARLSKVFATMLSAGVPILKSLTIVEQASLNAVYENSIANVRNAVREGRTISGPLEAYPALYPPMVTAMIAVGEESGTLDHMLLKINDFYVMEIEAMVRKLTALLEPVLIGTLGVIIGFIVIALWMPLFKVIQLIQQMK